MSEQPEILADRERLAVLLDELMEQAEDWKLRLPRHDERWQVAYAALLDRRAAILYADFSALASQPGAREEGTTADELALYREARDCKDCKHYSSNPADYCERHRPLLGKAEPLPIRLENLATYMESIELMSSAPLLARAKDVRRAAAALVVPPPKCFAPSSYAGRTPTWNDAAQHLLEAIAEDVGFDVRGGGPTAEYYMKLISRLAGRTPNLWLEVYGLLLESLAVGHLPESVGATPLDDYGKEIVRCVLDLLEASVASQPGVRDADDNISVGGFAVDVGWPVGAREEGTTATLVERTLEWLNLYSTHPPTCEHKRLVGDTGRASPYAKDWGGHWEKGPCTCGLDELHRELAAALSARPPRDESRLESDERCSDCGHRGHEHDGVGGCACGCYRVGPPQQEPSPLPWKVMLTCCGQDDGAYLAANWEQADSFREAYCTGVGCAPHGYSTHGNRSGHKRSGVIVRNVAGVPPQEETTQSVEEA